MAASTGLVVAGNPYSLVDCADGLALYAHNPQDGDQGGKKLLLQIKQDKQSDNNQKLTDLSALIRRVAISTTSRENCAGLTGQQWLEFLDQSMKSSPFTQGIGQLLANAPYQKSAPSEQDINQLSRLCEDWLNAQGQT